MKLRVILTIYLAAFVLVACGKNNEASKAKESATTATAPAKAPAAAANIPDESRKIYKERCAVCHGANGTGDGPGAASLKTKPRNYTDKAWQDSVTDEILTKAIIGGGLAVGRSAVMPANPDLKNKKEIVDGLVNIIRGFAN